MRRSITMLAMALILLMIGLSLRQIDRTNALPSLQYLGEGGSYTTESGHFIVKRLRPFRFEQEPGPSYDAGPDERVWASSAGPPSPKNDTWVSYGSVPDNCDIEFVAIDDDPDGRINTFYVDSDSVFDMPQGFVTGGSFTTNSSGELKLHAKDSIGVWLNVCESPPEPTATVPTATPEEPTVTPSVTPTGTLEPTATPSSTPTSTPITPEPEETPEATPEYTPTPTREWRYPSCSRINFDMGGDVAKAGLYEMRELGGRHLYSWQAQDGWTDSGWFQDIDISFKNVFVQVFYVPPEGGPRVLMKMVNPAPGTTYGWMTRAICHAVEVAWHDTPPPEMIPPDATPDNSADNQALGISDIIWPGQEPEPTETPSSSLRG